MKQRIYAGAGGIKLIADVAGNADAPAVILLHGGGQTRHSWSGVMRALVRAGYHVINVDARGHGESDWSDDGVYSIQARALDLLEILQHVNGPVALVGASMGGATALYASCAQTEHPIVARVLVDIVPNPAASGIQRIKEFMHAHLDGFDSIEAAIAAVVAYNPERVRSPDPQGIRKNLRETSTGRLHWHWDPKVLTLDAEEESAALLEAINSAPSNRLKNTLLVRGLRSDVVLDENVVAFRNLLPDLEVFDVEGASHMVAGDKNDVFNAGIISYLQRHLPIVATPIKTQQRIY